MYLRFSPFSLVWSVLLVAALALAVAAKSSSAASCLVWQSNVTTDDLGKTGATGLFASWGQVRSRSTQNLSRISGGRAPDGSLAYEIFYDGDDNPGTRGPNISFDQTPGEALRHVYGEAKLFFPPGYWTFYSSGHKLVRLWAGLEGAFSGGTYGREIVNDASSTLMPVPNRFRTYSYYRNRPTEGGVVDNPPRSQWSMPEGRWVTIALELFVNAPGQSNGYLKLFVDGGEVLRRDGINWLHDAAAGFQGFAFSGGVNGYRIVDQKLWMKDFRLYALDC